MKKILTFLSVVSFSSALSAQTYCEDFEGLLESIGASSSVWTIGSKYKSGLNPPFSDS